MNLGKDIGTNAEDFEHMEDFTVAETLESINSWSKSGKCIDIT